MKEVEAAEEVTTVEVEAKTSDQESQDMDQAEVITTIAVVVIVEEIAMIMIGAAEVIVEEIAMTTIVEVAAMEAPVTVEVTAVTEAQVITIVVTMKEEMILNQKEQLHPEHLTTITIDSKITR